MKYKQKCETEAFVVLTFVFNLYYNTIYVHRIKYIFIYRLQNSTSIIVVSMSEILIEMLKPGGN